MRIVITAERMDPELLVDQVLMHTSPANGCLLGPRVVYVQLGRSLRACSAREILYRGLVGPTFGGLRSTCGNRNCIHPDHAEPFGVSEQARAA